MKMIVSELVCVCVCVREREREERERGERKRPCGMIVLPPVVSVPPQSVRVHSPPPPLSFGELLHCDARVTPVPLADWKFVPLPEMKNKFQIKPQKTLTFLNLSLFAYCLICTTHFLTDTPH